MTLKVAMSCSPGAQVNRAEESRTDTLSNRKGALLSEIAACQQSAGSKACLLRSRDFVEYWGWSPTEDALGRFWASVLYSIDLSCWQM